MSQQQTILAQTALFRAGSAQLQCDLTLDLIVIEAGLRLKVLPVRDAIIRGERLNFSVTERRARRRALFAFCENAQFNIVDVGLFADAVARRPDIAKRLWRALHPSAQR